MPGTDAGRARPWFLRGGVNRTDRTYGTHKTRKESLGRVVSL